MKKLPNQSAKYIAIAILIGSCAIALSILISALMSLLTTQDNKDPQKAYENIGYVKVDKSPILGSQDAPVTIIEYTDFDCPVCKAASDEVLPKLKKDYIQTGKAKFIFKSLPIQSTHPEAFRKTEAAYCARAQGGDKAFFAYYDSLFAKFGFSFNLENELVALAEQQSLDADKFRTCLQNRSYKETVEQDILEANLINSPGTPTWLIGKTDGSGLTETVKVNGLIEYPHFQRIITKVLASKTQ